MDGRQGDFDLAVEPSRPKQCAVEAVSAVGGRKYNHCCVGLESVHFNEQLVQSVVALLVSATHPATTFLADCVDLINEND